MIAIVKSLSGIGRVLSLAALIAAGQSSVHAVDSLSEVQRDLPRFELNSVATGSWNAESLQGKPWVINFWASWCPPCVEEIPSMNAAWESLEPDGIGMLAINAGEGEATVAEFLTRVPIDFPVLIGDGDSLPNWSVRALPTTVVVNADGQVVFQALGPRDWADEELLGRIRELL